MPHGAEQYRVARQEWRAAAPQCPLKEATTGALDEGTGGQWDVEARNVERFCNVARFLDPRGSKFSGFGGQFLVVAFLLPPLSVDVCIRTKCHVLGGQLTSALLCSTRGELLRGFLAIRGLGGVFGVFSPRGHRAERRKRLEFVFFVKVGRCRLPFQASLATPVLVRPSCSQNSGYWLLTGNADSGSLQFGIRACTMAPRRRPREGVAEQAIRQEAGDAAPPQQTQPLPQDAHSGIVPPPPPPQVAQGLDLTRFLEGMAQFVAQHRDASVPQGGTGKVLREFLQFQPPQFLGQPDPDIARAWLDAVEQTFRSMECVPEERVLLASYQLQALTWWSSEWETTFQSRPLRQIPWQEFVISFERAFCPTYVRTERLYQFLDLQQRDFTVVQYRARFVELGSYAPQIMADEGLRTQQFVRG
ncbi:hypothetical protein Taro_033847, partial [Colocasia esculenta]|nr:hypothetical protein [Colocasia esculenta]